MLIISCGERLCRPAVTKIAVPKALRAFSWSVVRPTRMGVCTERLQMLPCMARPAVIEESDDR